MATKKGQISREDTYSESALAHLARVAQHKAAKRKAKAVLSREPKMVSVLPTRDTTCSVCLKPTRNFNARINVTRPDGSLFALGICSDCVQDGYTFDKEANVIRRPMFTSGNA